MMRSAFFKRSAALLCAVLLLFTLAVPAFAEGDLPRARRVGGQAGDSAFAGFCRAGTGYLRGGF